MAPPPPPQLLAEDRQSNNTHTEKKPSIRMLPLKYDHTSSDATAMTLVQSLDPSWKDDDGEIEFVRFKDGITNTLFKAVKQRPGLSVSEIDAEAVLLRAYGEGTEVLIDRDREASSHSALSRHGLAPPLLARFENGLLYRFIQGEVCSPVDLRRPNVWRAVARRLAQWHATMPLDALTDAANANSTPSPVDSLLCGGISNGVSPSSNHSTTQTNGVAKSKTSTNKSSIPTPNLWTVMEKWIDALPTRTDTERTQQTTLHRELRWAVTQLGTCNPSSGVQGLPDFVFAHCDLLSGNVIMQPKASPSSTSTTPFNAETTPLSVSFIDYEYTTPAPAAFDLANHFAEWGGFECEYHTLPTKSQRRNFLEHYLPTFHSHAHHDALPESEAKAQLANLEAEVDRFRGIPGLYWGIWALIQAEISNIDFDYAAYAPLRLGEYWGWKRCVLTNSDAKGMLDTLPSPTEEERIRESRWSSA